MTQWEIKIAKDGQKAGTYTIERGEAGGSEFQTALLEFLTHWGTVQFIDANIDDNT